jgi:hypothetical protein
MCTWETTSTTLVASAKAPGGEWTAVTDAHIYFDHPQSAALNHALMIDLVDTARGPSSRIALELSTADARRLVAAIEQALNAVDPAVLADS